MYNSVKVNFLNNFFEFYTWLNGYQLIIKRASRKKGSCDITACCFTCITPEGQGYAQSARTVAGLLAGARKLGRSGVALKDTSRADALEGSEALTLE